MEPGEPILLQVDEVIIGTEGECSFTFADTEAKILENGKAYNLRDLDFKRAYHETVLDHCVMRRISFVPRIINAHAWLKTAVQSEDYKCLQRN